MGISATVVAAQDRAPQHLQALEYANRVRLARAELKRRVAARELSAAEVLLNRPWQAESMSVSDLVMSQRRWGRARCRRLLVSLGVPENKRLETLTERQRRCLAAVLAEKEGARPEGAPQADRLAQAGGAARSDRSAPANGGAREAAVATPA